MRKNTACISIDSLKGRPGHAGRQCVGLSDDVDSNWKVTAVLAGPPCRTVSAARYRGDQRPRTVRA